MAALVEVIAAIAASWSASLTPPPLDSDGDGIPDLLEDKNRDGIVDPDETDPLNPDTDGDGIPDGVEDANRDGVVDPGETDPRLLDTDGDGIPDGVEDANRDGVVDPGETDPRRFDTDRDGLSDSLELALGRDPRDPSHPRARRSLVELPEPLHYDLMRGLGAARGELEVNAMFVVLSRARHRVAIHPEIEWAFADGHAVEAELVLHDVRLDALKLGYQGTAFTAPRLGLIGGVQVLAELQTDGSGAELSVVDLFGWRWSPRWSSMTMAGILLDFAASPRPSPTAWVVLNPTVFFEPRGWLVLGLEQNLLASDRSASWRAIPQLHLVLGQHWSLQLGGGPAYEGQRWFGEAIARVIWAL